CSQVLGAAVIEAAAVVMKFLDACFDEMVIAAEVGHVGGFMLADVGPGPCRGIAVEFDDDYPIFGAFVAAELPEGPWTGDPFHAERPVGDGRRVSTVQPFKIQLH